MLQCPIKKRLEEGFCRRGISPSPKSCQDNETCKDSINIPSASTDCAPKV